VSVYCSKLWSVLSAKSLFWPSFTLVYSLLVGSPGLYFICHLALSLYLIVNFSLYYLILFYLKIFVTCPEPCNLLITGQYNDHTKTSGHICKCKGSLCILGPQYCLYSLFVYYLATGFCKNFACIYNQENLFKVIRITYFALLGLQQIWPLYSWVEYDNSKKAETKLIH
jgi:hypothetical protein